jgi:hypothetical protein
MHLSHSQELLTGSCHKQNELTQQLQTLKHIVLSYSHLRLGFQSGVLPSVSLMKLCAVIEHFKLKIKSGTRYI